MTRIRLPANNWRPRAYQMNIWRYLEGGGKRAIAIWHRRAGKDDIALHWSAIAAHQRVGGIWHCLPEGTQARKAIWAAVNPRTGRRRIDDAFPQELRAQTLENEMFIKFKNGSTWQVVGSDNYKSLVGTPPVGIVFSEWAKAHPGAWAYLAPILVENKGWALAITTPEGTNHAHAMYEMARNDPDWFAETLTVEDTIRLSLQAGEEPPVTLEDVEKQRIEYHSIYGEEAGDALIQQEFFCSWTAAILGSVWGNLLEKAQHEGRLCDLNVIRGVPVHTAWDIGIDDPMAVWVFQVGPGWVHVVDYVEGSGHGFDYYTDWLKDRGYVGGIDWVPHDAKMREPGAKGRTRIETLIELGRNPRLVPDHKPMDRVNAGRKILPRCYFDATRCKQGLECLRNYRFEWDESARTFRKTIKHDWSSHGGDAFGHLAVAVEFPTVKPKEEKPKQIEIKPLTVNDLLRRATGGGERRWV